MCNGYLIPGIQAYSSSIHRVMNRFGSFIKRLEKIIFGCIVEFNFTTAHRKIKTLDRTGIYLTVCQNYAISFRINPQLQSKVAKEMIHISQIYASFLIGIQVVAAFVINR